MSKEPNILIRFWQELKRRKVFKVLAIYVATAYIIIEVTNNLVAPLDLPSWIAKLVILLLVAGLPVAAVLSWIFDFTPQGIKKTESIEELAGKEIVTPPARRRLKVSDIAITVLAIAVIILAWPKIFKQNALDRLRSSGEKLSIAVMPFQNMTNDTTWNVWQGAIQQNLISFLSNYEDEFKVRQKESIKSLLQNQGVKEYASISPALAGTISKKLDADIYINGNIQKAGSQIRLNAQLIDTKSNDVLKSFEVLGPNDEEEILSLSDTLRKKVTDFLIISKLMKQNPFLGKHITSSSPEAVRYCSYGLDACVTDWQAGQSWLLKALAIDSNYFDALWQLGNTYIALGMNDKLYELDMKVYKMRERWGPYQQAAIDWMYSNDFESPQEGIKYLRQKEQIDDQDPSVYFRFGMNYLALKQYNLAIPAWEKAVKIYHSWGEDDILPYYCLGLSYHKAGQYRKEKKLYKKINKFIPENPPILTGEALLAFAEKDTVRANRYIEKYISFKKEKSYPEASIEAGLGDIYFQAGDLKEGRDHYIKAISLAPEVPYGYFNLANFLIDSNYCLGEVPGLLDKAMELAANKVDYYNYMATKGWALFKQGKNQEALEILQKAWDEAPYKLYSIGSHFEEVKKAVDGQK